MPLCNLINVPDSPQDWEFFSWSNKTQNDAIRQAIKSHKNINLVEYQLYPLNLNSKQDFAFWLLQNQQAHDDFNGVLGLQGSDISELDNPGDKNKLTQWIYSQYLELFSASAALKI